LSNLNYIAFAKRLFLLSPLPHWGERARVRGVKKELFGNEYKEAIRLAGGDFQITIKNLVRGGGYA